MKDSRNPSRRRPHGVPRSAPLWRSLLGGAALVAAAALSPAAGAQSLTVLPVTMQLAPGQTAVAFTVINQSDTEASYQIRGFRWSQVDGNDQLTPTEELLASPPIGTIPAATSQVVRIAVRHPPQGREASYRILLDQIPPPADPGTVRIALRLSIPIFAEPSTRIASHVRWQVENNGGEAYLVATNDGNRHETVRNIVLTAPDGRAVKAEDNVSPYILPGSTRRWRMPGLAAPAAGSTLRLTARADSGALDQPVTVAAAR
ncbi:fimbrial chaperone protein [Nitrospirillum viridazoti]|uniref:Fimbrial chaperone protein n=1 Tax=Nitrospirillum amazonense TaxID=28077 RepID=A0A560IYQ0_9PROT|nr:fimbrial chaperone protein [Nitrospirillum amazonense]